MVVSAGAIQLSSLPLDLAPRPPALGGAAPGRAGLRTAAEARRSDGLLARCDRRSRQTTLDHFSWAPRNVTTYSQRYFVCLEDGWSTASGGERGPIFFYAGNEADVTLYLNNTGLMWESAPKFGALLIFAEHRYYGESLPFGKHSMQHLQFLTSEQAMADFAELLIEFKREQRCESSPVVAFGGSYGGMLAAWMRMKYPHVIDGSIASSAPILAFQGMQYDAGSYAKAVTYDASPAAGAPPGCVDAVRGVWGALTRAGATAEGRHALRGALGLCPDLPFESAEDVQALAAWLQSALDYIAMGNFPYESSYITNGNGILPAFPMRAGCKIMVAAASSRNDTSAVRAMVDFANIFYNSTGVMRCVDSRRGVNPDTDDDASLWGLQYCTEMFMPSSRDGVADMFWAQPWDEAAAVDGCMKQWGVVPRPMWPLTQWGGPRISAASNIVFANGEYDPWRGGGVLTSPNPSLVALDIPGAAHHLDLMFSNPADTPEVLAARAAQEANIAKWVQERTANDDAAASSLRMASVTTA